MFGSANNHNNNNIVVATTNGHSVGAREKRVCCLMEVSEGGGCDVLDIFIDRSSRYPRNNKYRTVQRAIHVLSCIAVRTRRVGRSARNCCCDRNVRAAYPIAFNDKRTVVYNGHTLRNISSAATCTSLFVDDPSA